MKLFFIIIRYEQENIGHSKTKKEKGEIHGVRFLMALYKFSIQFQNLGRLLSKHERLLYLSQIKLFLNEIIKKI